MVAAWPDGDSGRILALYPYLLLKYQNRRGISPPILAILE
ncbi:hypothetical protein KNP414_02030 [Paenibacillus mucilaginosus KNP414]|uniref:Uncharacterized protein n=1 Tax=Paenibacillus mucilaginosus (strain KNP414) TaxID=1036673 RepID=F8FRN4_PAEMK|nr:hypothetical protein KNP414_02030 [Paenibacillus mucilaginosus KNP414]